MKKNLRFLIALGALMVVVSSPILAQVTTSSFSGVVVDDQGKPLPGATVMAVHQPTGTKYGVITRTNGRYNIPNVRIGGPYKIEASFVGFDTQTKEGFMLTLGKNQAVNFDMKENTRALDDLVVTAGSSEINPDRTGAATVISNDQLIKIPTISRSAGDIYKLTPSSDGNSFGGRNDQFNNFSLDGSIFNNPFGLDAATPGGQSNAQPISLDAIEQIQVSLAPYDVTQAGFTGAAVNAVTKSGTNEFKGTAFAFYRNQDLTGSKVSGDEIFVPDLNQIQAGFSVGGPIIKDKLFFFANFELERREDLGSNFTASRPGSTGDNVSRISATDLNAVSDILRTRYGYETGPFEGYTHDTNNQKGILKLDWNINDKHTLTATYNFLDAFREQNAHPSALGRRGPDALTLQFFNSGYRINNKIHSGIVELRSLFSSKHSNKLQVGFTKFTDSRDPFSEPFPVVNILQSGLRGIIAGHEPFSINNKLDQSVFQFTDNFEIYTGDHTITIGTSFEKFQFDNSFNLGVYEPFGVTYPGGTFENGFTSVADFLAFVNAGSLDPIVDFARTTFADNNANNSWALAETNVGQLAFYVQDKWALNDRMTLTYGVRVDKPLFFDTDEKIQENIDRKGGLLDPANGIFTGSYAPSVIYYDENNEPVQFDHTELPTNKPLISPRIGFNWDVNGDQSFQLRGGSGLFTGRFPFVWLGNQVANPDFFFYTVTDPDFQFPQVWRTNIGYDRSFGDGWFVTTDLIYTKDINAMMVRNFGLRTPTGFLSGVDNRAYYLPTDKSIDPFGNVGQNAYVFTSESTGRSINWTIEVKKQFSNGIYATLGYNYLDAKDISSIEAEISGDAFERNAAVNNVNTSALSPSLYGNRHRFVATANKAFEYGGGKWKTTVSLFAEYAEGGRYSYTYAGDANGDGSVLNDLIYVPRADELFDYNFFGDAILQGIQRSAFNNFINQDPYLSSRRGQYAERNAALSPWYGRWDMRVLQDYNLPNGKTLQFSLDVLNVGNMLNSDWGVRQNPLSVQPISITVNQSTLEPTYTFVTNQRETFVDDFSLLSRWQVQLGLRYIF
ncbi:TonB-dependent receptor [Roseivirga misakiensis]|uniref:TonB-dependent receptor n=1 Tax=Roseivirga misakiensis TaxID=1563681 RepID=A0A1E5T2J4_9BACT|nr:carboxypeptidase regulatory-like domain-containing protein [Roseivirga misakiensis]OEK05566.1 TonB-dependent receptor [Roseivirga misakiensis]